MKVALAAAGLLACLCSCAIVYVCLIHNLIVDANEDGQTPWKRKFGEDFNREILPFGCGVFFFPSPTKYKNSQAVPSMSYGIFMGYRQTPGMGWNGQYLVADIESFVGQSLHIDAAGAEYRVKPHVTEQIRLGKRGLCDPLKNVLG